MRCKNCGSKNDDKLYICQNCGSPLYDEDEIVEQNDDLGKTRVAPVIKPDKNLKSKSAQREEEKKDKQITIAIIVLAVVLVAVIIVTIGVAVSAKKDKDNTTTTTEITTEQTTDDYVYTKSTTTETTTEAVERFMIKASCGQGGEVDGDGEFEVGKKCTLVARADDGFMFDGWYEGDKKVSSKETYSFTVKSDASYKAVFEEVTTQTTTKQTTTTITTTEDIEEQPSDLNENDTDLNNEE